MKRVLSLLLVVTLILSIGAISFAAPAVADKTGVLKSFTSNSCVIAVAGKATTYKYNAKTSVYRIDQEVGFTDVAKKGMLVTFRASGSTLTYINFPNIGAELQGSTKVALSDRRINITDSSLCADATTALVNDAGDVTQTTVTRFKELEPIACDEYVYSISDTQLELGDINVVPDTMKVWVNGTELKVIDAAAKFDATFVGDEVQLINYKTKTDMSLLFEVPFNTEKLPLSDAVGQAAIEKIVKVSYVKKMYEISTTETNFLPVNSGAVIELNGKEVTLAKAMMMGNAWAVTCNPDNEIIHANAYYNGATAVFTGLTKNQIKVNILNNGKVVGSDVLTLSDAVSILDATGATITAKNLVVGTKIAVTTEPADNYKVVSVFVNK